MIPGRHLFAICATSGLLVFSRAEASERLTHEIAAQPLAQALSKFVTQTGLQVVYVSEIAAAQASKGAPRGLPAADALQHLLAGTGLRFEFLNDRTVRIFAASNCALRSGCTGPPVGAAALAAERPPRPPSLADPLEEVIVNGLRWWLDPTQAVAPVTVLDRRDIERGGRSSIGDVLQASGASAAFGADAIGGVVNIVTRRSSPGLELRGTRSITERGDGEIVTGQAAIGFDLLFGGVGSITEELLAYVMPGAMINRGTSEQRIAELVLSGPGGRMLGRDVQWVLGASYRREAGSVAPDSLHANYVGDQFRPAPDLFRLTPEVSGAYHAYELYTAVQVPLLHDRPWARDMVLDAGLRWSDYGSFDSRTTWQAGLRWQLAEELALRANYAEVFRAPSLAELYERPTYAEQFVWDPCGNDPVPDQLPNCAADGVPGGAYVQGGSGTASGNHRGDGLGVVVVYGGNPELEPQTGRTLGAGLVYTPVWAEGLSASVDYFQTIHANRARVSPEWVLIVCADFGVCPGITRNEEGRVVQLETRYRNFGKSEVRALDFVIDWSTTNRSGELNATLLATYLDRWDRVLPGGEVQSYAGTFDAGARPHWRASGHMDWRAGPWMASYAAEYIGSYSELVYPFPPFGVEFEPFDRRVDPVLYHDVEAGFTFDSGVTVRAVISNVTDEDPPYLNIAPANTDVATYRLLGRSYFLELRYQV